MQQKSNNFSLKQKRSWFVFTNCLNLSERQINAPYCIGEQAVLLEVKCIFCSELLTKLNMLVKTLHYPNI